MYENTLEGNSLLMLLILQLYRIKGNCYKLSDVDKISLKNQEFSVKFASIFLLIEEILLVIGSTMPGNSNEKHCHPSHDMSPEFLVRESREK